MQLNVKTLASGGSDTTGPGPGSVVLVTGAAQGIGATFAKAFAATGASVVLADINLDKSRRVADEIVAADANARALAVQVDVASESSVAEMTAKAAERFGHVDVLVNNAALFSTLEMRPFQSIPVDEWQRVLNVNINGPFLCTRAIVPMMIERGYGRIINISSGAVTLGRPNYLHYITSKSALIGMTRSMARELGPSGITVNAILPGSTVTEIDRKTVTEAQRKAIIARQCIPRHQVPEDLVSTALFLASEASGFITGQSITVDGGATHP